MKLNKEVSITLSVKTLYEGDLTQSKEKADGGLPKWFIVHFPHLHGPLKKTPSHSLRSSEQLKAKWIRGTGTRWLQY